MPDRGWTDGRRAARIAAGLLAAIAWIGLGTQFDVLYSQGHSLWATLATLAAYFTIIANFLIAALFTCLAIGSERASSPWLIAGAVISIVLVGVVYFLLLRKLYHLSGEAAFSNMVMHDVVPCLTPLFWLGFVPKGRLRFHDPLQWALLPIAYFAYALARGALTGFYPYPFMDVARIGWAETALNALVIAACYVLGGWAFVALDRALAKAGRLRKRPYGG